jgi:hypothetical protein
VAQTPSAKSAALLSEERGALGMANIDVDREGGGDDIETLACFAELPGDHLLPIESAALEIVRSLARRTTAVEAGAFRFRLMEAVRGTGK